MTSIPDLSSPLGLVPPSRAAVAPERPARQLVTDDPVQRRVALPDTMRERFRARPKHQRPTPSDIRKNRETPVGGSMPTGRKATSPPQLSSPSAGFLTQVLGQVAGFDGPEALQRHRDGPAKGSDAYRRAGGEPEVFPTGPTVFRMAV